MPPRKRKDESDPDVENKKSRKKASSSNGNSPAAAANNDIEEQDDEEPQIVLEGSMINGELLCCGGTNWDLLGRKQVPKGVKNVGGRNLWSPHRVEAMKGIQIRTVASGCQACHSVIISTEGKAYTWGRNDKGQLGHGDVLRRDVPTLLESLSHLNIVDASCGKNHTLVITERGHVYAFGDNKMGQLGLGNQTPQVPSPTRIKYSGPPIRRAACGSEFSLLVNVKGHLYSFGCPEYGQLGHNSDGKYFVSSNKLSYSSEMKPRLVNVFIEKTREGNVVPINDVEIVDFACGANHSIAMDRKKRVFTWGFGGYGRLGHAEPKDEWIPRLVKFFDGPNRGASMVQSGASFNLVVNELGMLYYWGQNKSSGEATMYPKPVQDLSGWAVRSMGCCNRSIVVAADESLITWGPSPTFGELGYGVDKSKSSTTPQEVKCLNGVHILKVACGYAHNLMLARNSSDEDKANIEKLPSFIP